MARRAVSKPEARRIATLVKEPVGQIPHIGRPEAKTKTE
jgi:hypothetical protein